ncbi:MAG: hypothetical protein IJR17_04670 [Clostridia bacterium]|nr:hypothetical protein [Clostridia bacterium]
MKRLLPLVLLVLLLGCSLEDPLADRTQTLTASVSLSPSPTGTSLPTQNPLPPLPTLEPRGDAVFAEELFSFEGSGLLLEYAALEPKGISAFALKLEALAVQLQSLSDEGRGLTAREGMLTASNLEPLLQREKLAESAGKLMDVLKNQNRTESFFTDDGTGAEAYREALSRYMGEAAAPGDMLLALETQLETQAHILGAILDADSQVVRKQSPFTKGSFEKDMALLYGATEELCPSVPLKMIESDVLGAAGDIPRMAFWYYPGQCYLAAYGEAGDQAPRWRNASMGYLWGLGIHFSHSVLPYLSDMGTAVVLYGWNERLLEEALTGVSALLIHYYGYSEAELEQYLSAWGAGDHGEVFYNRAMDDPFTSLVGVYGYTRYTSLMEEAIALGCKDERQFLDDYLALGPAPYAELREHLLAKYEKDS